MSKNPFFKNIEKKTGVNMNDIFKLADSLSQANFQDEQTVRHVIHQVSQIANRPVSKEQEDKIVEAVIKNNMPMDFSTISEMLNNKKK